MCVIESIEYDKPIQNNTKITNVYNRAEDIFFFLLC